MVYFLKQLQCRIDGHIHVSTILTRETKPMDFFVVLNITRQEWSGKQSRFPLHKVSTLVWINKDQSSSRKVIFSLIHHGLQVGLGPIPKSNGGSRKISFFYYFKPANSTIQKYLILNLVDKVGQKRIKQ